MKRRARRHKMKSKVSVDIIVHDERWQEAVDFDVFKVIDELKELTFGYVEEVYAEGKHEFLSVKNKLNVNVCLSNDEEVHRLNKEFRGMDKPTNVLSFANLDDEEFEAYLARNTEIELGDIIIALETMLNQSKDQDMSLHDHYCHILIHGILHLLGFDHLTKKDYDFVVSIQNKVLRQI